MPSLALADRRFLNEELDTALFGLAGPEPRHWWAC